MGYINELSKEIDAAELYGRQLELKDVTGLSGDKLVGFLQRCAEMMSREVDACYLEVGVFQGLTLTSVASVAPDLQCFGIDNFSQLDLDGKNRSIVEDRLNKFTNGNATIINEDFEEALLSLEDYIGNRKVAVYFVDGPHDYRSQYLCLDFVRRFLSDKSVIIVDDSNYEHVRRANHDWLKANRDYALLYEAYTPMHPKNMAEKVRESASAGWWNGANVIVHDPDSTLERIYPAVKEKRDCYYNDHTVHVAKYASLAPRLLNAISSGFLVSTLKLANILLHKKKSKRFTSMNTYSENLITHRKAGNIKSEY